MGMNQGDGFQWMVSLLGTGCSHQAELMGTLIECLGNDTVLREYTCKY
jgi:hypothetical protein